MNKEQENKKKQIAPKPKNINAPGAKNNAPQKSGGNSVYARKRMGARNKSRSPFAGRGEKSEFDQQIIDIARVTRVMAGGKRMRFRACIALGNKKGKIAVGLAKGADVSIAVNKAVNNAKKEITVISIVNGTIPHAIYQKLGSAKVLLKPARKGSGVIAGGAVRAILQLAGIKNVTSKNLGTNNKVNVAKCTVKALENLKKVEVKKDKSKNGPQPKEAAKSNGKKTKSEQSEADKIKKEIKN